MFWLLCVTNGGVPLITVNVKTLGVTSTYDGVDMGLILFLLLVHHACHITPCASPEELKVNH